jgi:hypothetical protein
LQLLTHLYEQKRYGREIKILGAAGAEEVDKLREEWDEDLCTLVVS